MDEEGEPVVLRTASDLDCARRVSKAAGRKYLRLTVHARPAPSGDAPPANRTTTVTTATTAATATAAAATAAAAAAPITAAAAATAPVRATAAATANAATNTDAQATTCGFDTTAAPATAAATPTTAAAATTATNAATTAAAPVKATAAATSNAATNTEAQATTCGSDATPHARLDARSAATVRSEQAGPTPCDRSAARVHDMLTAALCPTPTSSAPGLQHMTRTQLRANVAVVITRRDTALERHTFLLGKLKHLADTCAQRQAKVVAAIAALHAATATLAKCPVPSMQTLSAMRRFHSPPPALAATLRATALLLPLGSGFRHAAANAATKAAADADTDTDTDTTTQGLPSGVPMPPLPPCPWQHLKDFHTVRVCAALKGEGHNGPDRGQAPSATELRDVRYARAVLTAAAVSPDAAASASVGCGQLRARLVCMMAVTEARGDLATARGELDAAEHELGQAHSALLQALLHAAEATRVIAVYSAALRRRTKPGSIPVRVTPLRRALRQRAQKHQQEQQQQEQQQQQRRRRCGVSEGAGAAQRDARGAGRDSGSGMCRGAAAGAHAHARVPQDEGCTGVGNARSPRDALRRRRCRHVVAPGTRSVPASSTTRGCPVIIVDTGRLSNHAAARTQSAPESASSSQSPSGPSARTRTVTRTRTAVQQMADVRRERCLAMKRRHFHAWCAKRRAAVAKAQQLRQELAAVAQAQAQQQQHASTTSAPDAVVDAPTSVPAPIAGACTSATPSASTTPSATTSSASLRSSAANTTTLSALSSAMLSSLSRRVEDATSPTPTAAPLLLRNVPNAVAEATGADAAAETAVASTPSPSEEAVRCRAPTVPAAAACFQRTTDRSTTTTTTGASDVVLAVASDTDGTGAVRDAAVASVMEALGCASETATRALICYNWDANRAAQAIMEVRSRRTL